MAQLKSYNKITQEEWHSITHLNAQRGSLSEIARQLKRNKNTISRKKSRNKDPNQRVVKYRTILKVNERVTELPINTTSEHYSLRKPSLILLRYQVLKLMKHA